MEAIINNILEFFYILIGLLSIMTAVRVFKDATHPTRLGTATFWLYLVSFLLSETLFLTSLMGSSLFVWAY